MGPVDGGIVTHLRSHSPVMGVVPGPFFFIIIPEIVLNIIEPRVRIIPPVVVLRPRYVRVDVFVALLVVADPRVSTIGRYGWSGCRLCHPHQMTKYFIVFVKVVVDEEPDVILCRGIDHTVLQ